MSLEAGPLRAEEFASRIAAEAPKFGLRLSPEAFARLACFLAELDLWRRRTNLTGPLPASELVAHALESALGADLVPIRGRVLDIGTGAGFPGIPLAIVRPDVSMTLLEPRAKRIQFLRHVLRAVPVANAETLRKRLEAAGLEAERFDCAVERAVGDVPGVIGKASFLKPGGSLLAWTTAPEALLRALPGFSPGRLVCVPGSRQKVIAELIRSG